MNVRKLNQNNFCSSKIIKLGININCEKSNYNKISMAFLTRQKEVSNMIETQNKMSKEAKKNRLLKTKKGKKKENQLNSNKTEAKGNQPGKLILKNKKKQLKLKRNEM